MNLAKILDKTATLQQVMGDGSVHSLSAPPVPCTIAPADARTVAEYAQQGITCVHLVYSASDLGATTTERVLIDGAAYAVVGSRVFSNARFGPTIYVTACGPKL